MPDQNPNQTSVGDLMSTVVDVLDQRAEERHIGEMAEALKVLLGDKPGDARNPVQLGAGEQGEDGETRAVEGTPRVFVNDEMDRAFEQFAEPQVRQGMKPVDVYYGHRWIYAVTHNDVSAELRARTEWEMHTRQNASAAKGTFTGGLWTGQSAAVIPVPLQRAIELKRQDGGVLRPLCRNLDISEGGTLRYPVSSTATAVMVAEGAAAVGAEGPESGQIILTAKKMKWEGEATEEFLADSAINVVNWFTAAVGESFGVQEDQQICASTGLGAAYTENIRNNPTYSQTPIDAGNLVQYRDVTRLHRGVPKMYRRRRTVAFLGDSEILGWLEEILDTTGQPIFKPVVNQDQQQLGDAMPMSGTLLGRPVYEVPIAAGVLVCGPLDMYAHGAVRGGMTMRATDAYKWNEDKVSFKAMQRVDGTPFFSDTTGIEATTKSPFAELTGVAGPIT